MDASQSAIVVKADRLFSPHRGFVRGLLLHMDGGMISGLISADRAGDFTTVLNFEGSAISPPFCDYHLHFPKESLTRLDEIAETLLSCGIFCSVDGGDRDYTGLKVRNQLRERIYMKTAGSAIYKIGTYGRSIGMAVHSSTDARMLIDRLKAQGVDCIKVINSGILDPEEGIIIPGGFTQGELTEIIGHAKERGLRVFCHANGDGAIRDAVISGASCIVHGFFVSADTLSMMAEREVSFIPTVNALFSLATVYSDPAVKRRLEKYFLMHLETARSATELGVRVLPGSDAGPQFIPYGHSYLKELHLFHKAGISIERILSAASCKYLTAGLPADFLVLDGLSIRSVFRGGKEIKRNA
jgi:imidazolonepropionase-like amidohydrolase